MAAGRADFTLVFRHLSGALESGDDGLVGSLFSDSEAIGSWMKSWRERIPEDRRANAVALMRRINPVFIPRNHRVEEVIAAGYQGDYKPFRSLNAVLQNPFLEQSESVEYELAPEPSEVVQSTFCGT